MAHYRVKKMKELFQLDNFQSKQNEEPENKSLETKEKLLPQGMKGRKRKLTPIELKMGELETLFTTKRPESMVALGRLQKRLMKELQESANHAPSGTQALICQTTIFIIVVDSFIDSVNFC